jgi:NTE family protein
MRKGLTRAVKALRAFAYSRSISTPTLSIPTKQHRIGLALSGGFARGLAHIGVLKVLVENHIPIDALAGTSAGSLIAAAFASGCTIEGMIEEARTIRWKSFARWRIPRLGFASNERMEPWLHRVLRAKRFEELSIPLSVVAADISTGEAVVFRTGDLIPPLRASCSFPGLFTPVEYQGRLLIDGAIVSSVPVAALQDYGVDAVIAVHIKTNGLSHTPSNVFQVIGQAFQIAQAVNEPTWKQQCDVVIEPDMSEIAWDDFGRADEIIFAGEAAARKALPALRALLNSQTAQAPPTSSGALAA